MSEVEGQPEKQPVEQSPSEDVVIEKTTEKFPEQNNDGNSETAEAGDKEEQERLKKLEEARKRVEALRNRKKNKKSKKKDTAASTEETSTEGTPIPDSEHSEKAKTTEQVDEVDQKLTKEEDLMKDKNGEEVTTSVDKPAETTVKDELEQKVEGVEEVKEPVHDELDELFGKVEHKTGASVSLGRAEATESFLATIQKEQESFELEQYKTKVSDLEQQVKKLKFDNMEYETTIDDLHDEVSELKAQLARTQKELQELKSKNTAAKPALSTNSSTLQLSSFNTAQQQNSYQPSSLYTPQSYGNLPQQEHNTPVQPVDQELLYSKWKDWNVDMTSWRSIGTGPIVQF
ncbi:hypothetical protein ACO0RG_001306 [Hanseniaspora osmophila]|uniref:Binder of USO1 and GRH1 protein 1 n=1 Tax=Hanseniaspora osmophila TaxID=56408 RepID=A0A1E5RP44_9ASCO|nr:Binder of USO1 and GRH1 protein 1 [Hanseniaspora osmophila]